MTRYKFDISNLNGEELLDFDDDLMDILAFHNDGDFDYEGVEDYHQRQYDRYVRLHPNYQKGSGYDDDAWMYAQRSVVNKHLREITDEMISDYMMSRGSVNNEEVWDKATTTEQDREELPYQYGDRYDFGSWNNVNNSTQRGNKMKSIFSKAYIKNAEEVSLTEDEMNQMGRGYGSYGNDEKPFAGMFKRARESAEQKARDAKIAELREKYKDVLSLFDDNSRKAEDILESLHEALVPTSGEADTVMGEIIRAWERIAYRTFNDGDVWFCGYGIETLSESVEYLYDTVPTFKESIDKMVHNIRNFYTIDYDNKSIEASSEYEDWVANIAPTIIVEYLRDNMELIETENNDDSRSYGCDSESWVKDFLDEDESWDCSAYFDGTINEDEVRSSLESDVDWYGYPMEVDFSSNYVYVTFNGLTINELLDVMEKFDSRWVQSVVDEYTTYEDEDDDYEGEDEE